MVSIALSCVQIVLLIVSALYILVSKVRYGEVTMTPGEIGHQLAEIGVIWPMFIGLAIAVVNLAPTGWETLVAFRTKQYYWLMYWSWVASYAALGLWFLVASLVRFGGGA